jgi:tRNA(Ile)-lysidine synthetase-like protein
MLKGLDDPIDPIEWWFSGSQSKQNERWFQSNPCQQKIFDEFISEHFSKLLFKTETKYAAEYVKYVKYDILVSFQDIIVLDQFSRHIYRNDLDRISKIAKNTEMAAQIAIDLLKDQNTVVTSFTSQQQAFILLPLKHYNVELYFHFIMECLQMFQYTKHPQLMRFYKDLLKRYSKIENFRQAKCVKFLEFYIRNPQFDTITTCWVPPRSSHLYAQIPPPWEEHAFLCLTGSEIRILFEESIKNNGLVKTVILHLDKYLMTLDSRVVTVSLSGGVDSMVLCYILSHLQKEKDFTLQTYHYNGKNRPESDLEEDFVKYYCHLLDIPLCIRNISEVQRRDNDREFYEEHTRNIRFDMYKLIGQGGAIVLGHIHDDVTENIWTNFARGRDLFNLKKMQPSDTQNDVVLWRPFLCVEKSDILEFSFTFKIWFLSNSTPEWSNRGKFRSTFLPAVNAQYLPIAHKNVEFMAKSLEEYNTFLQAKLFEPFMKQIQPVVSLVSVSHPVPGIVGYHIPIDKDHIGLGLHFWQIIFGNLLHPVGIGLPSRKSLETMIQMLTTNSYGMITLKKELYVWWTDRQLMFVLFRKELIHKEIVDCETILATHWGKIQKGLGIK